VDLDKVDFWIYKNKDENYAIHLGTPGLPTFGYGGRIEESANGIVYSAKGIATGIQPFGGDSLGHDRFIFRQNLTELNLPTGEHQFVVKIKDVNGHELAEDSLPKANFKIINNPSCSGHSAPPLYDNFKGTTSLALPLPTTLERNHTFSFSDVTNKPVLSRIMVTGPTGNVFDQVLNPPVASKSINLTDLSTGTYMVRSFNSLGGETLTPFIRNFIFSLVVNHSDTIFQSLTAKPVKAKTARNEGATFAGTSNTSPYPHHTA